MGLKEALRLLYLQVHDLQQVALLLNEPPVRDSMLCGYFLYVQISDTADTSLQHLIFKEWRYVTS